MRVFDLPKGTPRAQGRAHGEAFRDDVRALTDIRIGLCLDKFGFPSRDVLLRRALLHFEVTKGCSPSFSDELVGIAEGAGLSVAELVVLNHYTDLRDEGASSIDFDDGGCSMLWTPSGILAQTWDMHISAMPHVLMLQVPEQDGRPAATIFSLTGCLGMAGMNDCGVAAGINNLRCTDAKPGVVWSVIIRKILSAKNHDEAKDVMDHVSFASGHHYVAADSKSATMWEVSGSVECEQSLDGRRYYHHTNHALVQEVAAKTDISNTSTTYGRYASMEASLQQAVPQDLAEAWRLLGSRDGFPQSTCTSTATYQAPHGSATCGAIAMDTKSKEVWACAGFVSYARPVEFQVGGR